VRVTAVAAPVVELPAAVHASGDQTCLGFCSHSDHWDVCFL
jgi:hypothetical protein